MQTSPDGIALIKKFEGCRLTAYPDPGTGDAPWTIGYGWTHPVELTQGQFDALVSFAYNVGSRALSTSTLLKKLNAGDIKGAADEFLRWNKSGGKVMPGLTNRRKAERALFLS